MYEACVNMMTKLAFMNTRMSSVIHHAHRPSVRTSIPAVPEASTITAPALPTVLPSSGSGGAGSTIGNGHHRRKSSVLSLGGKKSTRSRRKVLTACVDLVNERDEFGNTVLFSAASLGNVGCVNVLLEYKVWSLWVSVVSVGNSCIVSNADRSKSAQPFIRICSHRHRPHTYI